MIRSFKCKETKALFERYVVKSMPADIQRVALRKLKMLDSAQTLMDLWVPPSNRLEKLMGKLDGKYSIRINDQWRICFQFEDGYADNVEIIDYH